MNKLLLILALLPAAAATAQDVTIPTPVAAFFLEQNERAKILSVEVDSLHADIKILEQRHFVAKQLLATEKQKSVVYDSLLNLKNQDINDYTVQANELNKELNKQKRKTRIITIAAIVGGILIAIL